MFIFTAIFKIILVLLFALIVPTLVGIAGTKWLKFGEFSVTLCLVIGLFWEWALFSIVCIPLIVLGASFNFLVYLYSTVLFVLSLVGLWKYGISFGAMKQKLIAYWEKNSVLIYVVIVILIVICLVQLFLMHSDADDSEYVAIVTTTIQKNSLLQIDALIGQPAVTSMLKRIIAPFSLWCAYMSQVTGIHPAIFCHTSFPILLTIYSFFAFQILADEFFKENAKKRNIFLFVLYFCFAFGGYSTFTLAERLLLRGGQGKSVLAVLGIPLIFYLMLKYMKQTLDIKQWLGIVFIVLGCTMTSSMANILLTLLISCVSLCQLLAHRKWKEFLKWECVCIPCVVFIVLYAIG